MSERELEPVPTRSAFRRALGLYPLAFGAIGAGLGIGLADQLPNAHVSGLLKCAGLAIFLAAFVWRRTELGLFGTVVFFAGLHQSQLSQTRDHALRLQLSEWQSPVAANVSGRLVLDRSDKVGDLASTATLWAERIDIRHHEVAGSVTPSRLRVILPAGMEIKPGRVQCSGRLFLPSPPTLPGGFDRNEQLWRDGCVAVLRMEKVEQRNPAGWLDEIRSSLSSIADQCRRWIAHQLTLDLDGEPHQSAIIQGMVLGDPGDDGAVVEKTFRDSGTQHLFAVSGLHVGLIAMVAWAFLRWIPLHRSTRILILVGVVFAYAFVTGWRPSAARAACMIALMLSAGLLTRRSNLLNSLGAAWLVLLVLDTHQLFRPGFQLSFGVLLAIIVTVPWTLQKLNPWLELDPFLPRQLATQRQLSAQRFRQGLASTVIVSVAAWLGSFPLMLWHFQSLAPIGMLANCLLVPLAFGAILTSCLSLCAAGLHFVGFQVMLNNANWCFASVILSLTGIFSEAPGARFTLPQRPEAEVGEHLADGVFFEVPNGGSSMLLRVSDRNWLWDTGARDNYEFSIQPYLDRRGVHRLNGLILSHNDSQHVGGAALALRELRPATLIHSLHEPWFLDSGSSVLPSLFRDHTIQSRSVGRHDRLNLGRLARTVAGESSAFAEVLYPGADDLHDRADDRSLVWRIQMGPLRLLYLADAGFLTEKSLLESEMDLECDLLIHTQHGSDPGGLPEFLRRVRPKLILTSRELRHPEEKPLPRWLTACEEMGVESWNTREKGSIQWRLLSDGDVEIIALRSGDRRRLSFDTP